MIDSRARAILLRRIRWMVGLFMLGLFLSGVTAIPVETQMRWLLRGVGASPDTPPAAHAGLTHWLLRVHDAVREVNHRHPFIFYGYDWLAFGHFAIAIAFIGAWRDPVRNRWLFDFGLIACALVIPYALVFGHFRGIPLPWRLIDCSFGLLGAPPLLLCRRWTRRLEHA